MSLFELSHNIIILVYHSINEYREDRIRVPNIVTPSVFESQIQYLTSTANIISLHEFIDHLKEGGSFLKRSVIITFDDGYKDNLTIASPILQKHGLPATFFISSGCVGTDRMKWEDQLSCLVRRSKAKTVSINNLSFKIVHDNEKFETINSIVNILGYLHEAERLRVLDELKIQLEVDCDDQAGVMLTWDDVRQLAATPGFSIGSHATTHQHLTRISPDDATWEVTNSKQHLESEIGCPITLFSYPYGDFNQDVIAALQGAGYASAGTIEYGQNSIHSDPFRLKRVLVPNQSGAKFKVGMRLRTSVFGEFLRKSYNRYHGLSKNSVSY